MELEFIGDDYELTFTPTRDEQGTRGLTIRCPRGVVLDHDDVLAVIAYCEAWLEVKP